MFKLVTLVLVALLMIPAGVLGQDVVVSGYAAPVVTVTEPVAVTTYSAPIVTAYRAAPAPVYATAPAVVTYRQPLLRPRATVVRTSPAAVLAPPAVVTYSYPAVVVP